MQIETVLPVKNQNVKVKLDEPTKCPLCHHAIKPLQLHLSAFSDNNNNWFASIHHLCANCFQAFVSQHELNAVTTATTQGNRTLHYEGVVRYVGPIRHEEAKFDAEIEALSEAFVRIYNQAKKAEELEFDEVCGIGYRKDLEFLIKDYLIHKTPGDRETIEKMELGNCIANKVQNENVKAVASRCAWLGNDHAHYYKRHTDQDLTMLKKLIDTTVYWISAELTTEAALAIVKA